ncbi:MAG: histidine phosphatase family protein [Pseudomonadota bacterium]
MQSSPTESVTQRRVILIRHAKAVEEDAGGDHTRPLSTRGITDAGALAQWLAMQHIAAQQVLCSTATRTRQTLDAVGKNVPTILSDKLYLATTGEMLAQIQATDDAVTQLMVIGHNPGIHALLALLVRDYADEDDADRMIMKFPTAACAVLRFDASRWQDVAAAGALLERLRY